MDIVDKKNKHQLNQLINLLLTDSVDVYFESHILPPFINIRCFRLLKIHLFGMYLVYFYCVDSLTMACN
jgi:hypothetical protein